MYYEFNNELPLDNLSYYSHPREEMLEFIPKKARKLLDIGCGAGFFGGRVKEHLSGEVEVWGIEPIKFAANEAAKNLDHVFCGTIEETLESIPDNNFDCIIFNDVLEHLTDPEIVLQKIAKKLAPEGVIVASIPNVRYILVLIDLILYRDWKYQDWGVLDKTHLRFFTEKSIARLFDSAGYKIVTKKGTNLLPLDYKKHHVILSICSFIFPKYFKDMKYMNFSVSATLK